MIKRLLAAIILFLSIVPLQAFAGCDRSPSNGVIAYCSTQTEAVAWVSDWQNRITSCNRLRAGPHTDVADIGDRTYGGGTTFANTTFIGHVNQVFSCTKDGVTYNEGFNHTAYYEEAFNTQECLDRNAGINGESTWNNNGHCRVGCWMEFEGAYTSVTFNTSGGTPSTLYTGLMRYNGEACPANPAPTPAQNPEDPRPPQTCVPMGNQSACLKTNGDMCYTASTGKQICWQAAQVGQKYDGPMVQVRSAGSSPTVPNLQLPSGDTLQQSGQAITTQSTAGGTTTTTTTTNYVTVNGTNVSPTQNNGEPNTGTGTAPNPSGDETGSSGGGDCDTPPIVTGDNAIAAVATQAWATRCAVQAGNAANVTGDISDCSTAFTVEGTNANAVQLRAMRTQICGPAGEGNGDGPAPGDYLGEEGTPGGGLLEAEGTSDVTATLDVSGKNWNRTCPTIPQLSIMGKPVTINTTAFCNWMQISSVFILIIGALISARIIGSA